MPTVSPRRTPCPVGEVGASLEALAMTQKNTLARRDFLAAGSVLTAATLAGGGVFAAGDETIKVGLIGCGGRGSGAAKDCLNADDKVKIVAVGDVFKDRAEGTANGLKRQWKDRAPITPETTFVGLDAFQKVIDAGVDLVILATPPGFRPMHLEAAIKAKKHVFTEKPVAVDGPGIRKCLSLVEEAKKNNLAVVAGTQRRHQFGYLETIKRLQDGAIGDIVAGRCSWNQGNIWFRDRQPNMSDAHYQIHNWYHFNWLCGDHIVEQHVHNLDVINWVLGMTPIRCVGMGGRSNRRNGDANEVGNIFDHFSVELHYPKGIIIQSFCRQISGCTDDVSELVIGTKGRCQVNAYQINGKSVYEGDDTPYVQEHKDLIKSIREGKPLNELENVANSTLTAIMGRMSTYSGKAVTWEEAKNSTIDTFPKNLTMDASLKADPIPVVGKSRSV